MLFRAVGSHPVLVDFASSILDENDVFASRGASVVDRGWGARRWRADRRNAVAEYHIRRLARSLSSGDRVLVIGGGTVGKGLEPLYSHPDLQIVAFDIYASSHTQVIADAHRIPFRDDSFDAVVVQAVLEHVLDPTHVVAEISRVLKPRGLVYAETAFLQHVHEGPFDFTRFTESGHRWLFREFDLIDSGAVAGPWYGLVWTLDYLARSLFRSRRAGQRVRRVALPVARLDRYVPEPFAIDSASGVFFFGRLSDRPIGPKEIVAHYRGAQRGLLRSD